MDNPTDDSSSDPENDLETNPILKTGSSSQKEIGSLLGKIGGGKSIEQMQRDQKEAMDKIKKVRLQADRMRGSLKAKKRGEQRGTLHL